MVCVVEEERGHQAAYQDELITPGTAHAEECDQELSTSLGSVSIISEPRRVSGRGVRCGALGRFWTPRAAFLDSPVFSGM